MLAAVSQGCRLASGLRSRVALPAVGTGRPSASNNTARRSVHFAAGAPRLSRITAPVASTSRPPESLARRGRVARTQ